MNNNKKNEEFFKDVASKYVNQDGERLKRELEELERNKVEDIAPNLDKKIVMALRRNKIKKFSYYFASTAACVLILLISINLFLIPKQTNDSDLAIETETKDIIQLSTKLPTGYSIAKVDYDKGKTIYFVENETYNHIVLTVEKSSNKINTSEMQEIGINGAPVFALLKKDFNFFTFEKDNMLYTLTNRYDYEDLILLSKNLL